MTELTHKKLREAEFFLRRLTDDESEWMEQEPEAGDFYLNAFLSAARAVTLALGKERSAEYKAWSQGWFARLSREDNELCNFFKDQRNKSQKEGAVDLEEVTIKDVSVGQFLQEVSRSEPGGSSFMSSHAPGASQQTFTKSEFRFAGRTEHAVADVCRRYLALLEQLVHDFERDHPGTVDPPGVR